MNGSAAKEDTIVTIQNFGKKTEKLETYKYWEIVGELIWRGAERMEAYEAGKWCRRAEPGQEKDVKPDILLKIRSKK